MKSSNSSTVEGPIYRSPQWPIVTTFHGVSRPHVTVSPCRLDWLSRFGAAATNWKNQDTAEWDLLQPTAQIYTAKNIRTPASGFTWWMSLAARESQSGRVPGSPNNWVTPPPYIPVTQFIWDGTYIWVYQPNPPTRPDGKAWLFELRLSTQVSSGPHLWGNSAWTGVVNQGSPANPQWFGYRWRACGQWPYPVQMIASSKISSDGVTNDFGNDPWAVSDVINGPAPV